MRHTVAQFSGLNSARASRFAKTVGSTSAPCGLRQGVSEFRTVMMLDDVTNDGAYGVRLRRPLAWSGRRESNPQHLAWEASTLPLSYARAMSEFWQNLDRPPRKLWSMLTRPEA